MKLILTSLISIFLFISIAKANNFNCLVEAIYHEARSEETVSQLAVANVILTRVESSNFPDTICKVVHQGRYWKKVYNTYKGKGTVKHFLKANLEDDIVF